MKKALSVIASCFLLVFCFTFVSCGTSKLQGTYKLFQIVTITNGEITVEEATEDYNLGGKADFSYEFKKNGVGKLKTSAEQEDGTLVTTTEFNWKLDGSNLKLFYTNVTEDLIENKVEEQVEPEVEETEEVASAESKVDLEALLGAEQGNEETLDEETPAEEVPADLTAYFYDGMLVYTYSKTEDTTVLLVFKKEKWTIFKSSKTETKKAETTTVEEQTEEPTVEEPAEQEVA